MSRIEEALKQVAEMTPDEGFNLCGLDDYGSPDEQGLYLIDHFDTQEEAEAAKEERTAEDPDLRFFVYGPPQDAAPPKPSPAQAFMAGQSEEG